MRRDRRLRRLPRRLPRRVPEALRREFEREYTFGWLGILAEVAPSSDELVYAHHERGFALLSLRSPQLSRYYVQVAHDEDIARVARRADLGGAAAPHGARRLDARSDGPILEKGITGMRSYVCTPMQHERLFLAGDAAHIVPPTGAKGLNLAIHDVRLLGEALVRFFERGDRSGLDGYTDACLRRVWRAEHFSWWMTSMLHRLPGRRLRRAAAALAAALYGRLDRGRTSLARTTPESPT